MKNIIKSLFVMIAFVGMTVVSSPSWAAKWVQVGTLTCQVEPSMGLLVGSHRTAGCIYTDHKGNNVVYSADITRIGIDIGYTTGQTIVWAVLAVGSNNVDSLEGTYMGASAEATIVSGINANALVGGMKKSFALQPISIGMQNGLNFVAAATSLTLYDAE